MSNLIQIFDTTLRDGEQAPGCRLDTKEKVSIAIKLEELGVDIIESGFPISSPGDFKSVSEISKVIKSTVVCGLTRAIKKDIDVAADALKSAKKKRIHTGIGVSDYHIKYKFQSNKEDIKKRAMECVKYARKFTDDVEFYAEDAGRADIDFLVDICEKVIKVGATVVNIPDTTGYCLPNEYGNKIKYLMNNVSNIDKAILSTHCHNDLGLATANSIQGVINGARQIECTINGVGERAGNTSMEEVAIIIKLHNELNIRTNIISNKIMEMSEMISTSMNMPVQANKALVGKNAFSHSSGIHQDGFLKYRKNYEIIDPKEIGITSNKNEIILTARSGKSALKHRFNKIGYNIPKDKLEKIYKDFLILADKKKNITDYDLKKLI